MQPKAVFMNDSFHDQRSIRNSSVGDRVTSFLNLRTSLALSSAACVITGYLAFTRPSGEPYGVLDAAFILSLGAFLLSTVRLILQLARTSLNSGIRNIHRMSEDDPRLSRIDSTPRNQGRGQGGSRDHPLDR
ncbi:MAG TPA: hypothetical protein VK176_10630 [Phycisphaerales bacterium]|nr:hypothetical protein [Phycisphaerales bacterium]